MNPIPDKAMAKIRQYQQGIEIAKQLYDTYVTGVGDALGVDFTKQYFNGEAFVDRKQEEKK